MKALFSRSGMAIAVVLIFSTVLLMLGGAYIKTISNVQKVNPKLLEQVQADFFGQGISKIALLKFKKYPADFYHAFIFSINNPPVTNVSAPGTPTPFESFKGAPGSVLQNDLSITSPASIPIAFYYTDFKMVTHKAYNKDGLEIIATVSINGIDRGYKTTVEASRTRIL